MNNTNKINQDTLIIPISPIKLGKNDNLTDLGWTVTKSSYKRYHPTYSSFDPSTTTTT